MSLNKYKPHLYLLPEDDADRQIANGFILHPAVAERHVQIMPSVGGWTKVLDLFKSDYIRTLQSYACAHRLMLIDFDGDIQRRAQFFQDTPADLQPRVFLLGARETPESLKREVQKTFEQIGGTLAQECCDGAYSLWRHAHLAHNDADLQRLVKTVRPIIFPS